MHQIVSITETPFCIALDYMLIIFNKVVIGIGSCCSPVSKFYDELNDVDETDNVIVTICKVLWIINTVIIEKDLPELKTFTYGFGLVFFTITITIGVLREQK